MRESHALAVQLGLGAAALLERVYRPETAAGVVLEHPFWVLHWDKVIPMDVIFGSCILFLAGVLCSAAGIGGGGVYVAVLMVCAGLSAHDAVPLSKAIVLSGAFCSMILNFRRSAPARLPEANSLAVEDNKKEVIDRIAVRIVVPATLLGTFVGVLLNHQASELVIVSLLNIVLYLMIIMLAQKTWSQYSDTPQARRLPDATTQDSPPPTDAHSLLPAPADSRPVLAKKEHNHLTESILATTLLCAVILCGTFRFHMSSCRAELGGDHSMTGACGHPIMSIFGTDFKTWLKEGGDIVHHILLLPLWACVTASVYYGYVACKLEGHACWTMRQVVLYQVVALVTGVLAGLVGVGGGLILSPFFLLTGMDPAIAVGTSSTCVLFTSSSTALQYVLMDRIISSLAIVYGIVTAVAALVGTSLVHLVQDRSKNAKYIITAIVALGVLVSAVLCTAKLILLATETSPGPQLTK